MTSEGQRVWGAAVHVASQCKMIKIFNLKCMQMLNKNGPPFASRENVFLPFLG